MGALRDFETGIKKEIKATVASIKGAVEHRGEILQFLAKMRDLSVPSLTLYVREDIGLQDYLDGELKQGERYMGQITGVYVPPSVKSAQKVNVILFLHGDKVRVWNQYGTIRDYLNLPAMPLRQGLSTSGKPFILVAPTLGMKAAAEFGKVGKNIDQYLDDVMERLFEFGPPEFAPAKVPEIDQLIIAGHSGGYGPIQEILTNIKKYKKNIKEIWGFDIMYSDTANYMAAAGVTVYAYFNDTEAHSRALAKKKVANVFVMDPLEFSMVKGKQVGTRVKHDFLMQKFWLARCQGIGTNGGNADDQKLMI